MELIITLLPYITWIFTAVCWWRVFSKANIAGWKAIIPFYCDYNRFKLAGNKNWYFPYLLFTIGKQLYSIAAMILLFGNVIEFLQDGTFNASGIETKATSWLLTLIIIMFDIYIGRRIAKKFGKTDMFGIGLGLIPIIFVPVLAFGKAEYQDKEWI